MNNEKLIKDARFEYQDDDIRIDDNAKITKAGNEGHWVQAWVFVRK